MRIIITEYQSKILWLRRRLYDRELMDHLKDIVIEGFDYTDPCNYGDYDSYRINLVNDSAITFINSYTELSGNVYVEDNELEKFVADVIVSKHRSRIEEEWRDRDCDEEEEEEDDDDDKTDSIIRWWVDK